MMNPVYNLPPIHIIGGDFQTFVFDLVTEDGEAFDATNYHGSFSLVGYSNKTGKPILEKPVTFSAGSGIAHNLVNVSLESKDTVNLFGRYIYQISIQGSDGNTRIPGQGLLDVSRNIHPGFME